jgi:multicomponent Na+:H+ antiporter subunit G
MSEYFACFFLISGSFIIMLSGLGMMRLPDIYCRSHALAKSLPLGINLMLLGMWITLGHDLVGFKTFLAILFQAITIPLAGHLLAYIAFSKEIPRWRQKSVDHYPNSLPRK